MSTGFNAGLDSSDVELSFGEEIVWNNIPAIAFQAIRLLSEGLSESKTRTRPEEINASGVVAHALTTQVEASGQVAVAVSYLTYDTLFEGMLNGTWTTPLAIDAITIDTAVDLNVEASGNPGFTSTLSGKFDSIVAGQWFRTFNWATNPGNNGIFRAISVTQGASPAIQVAGGDSSGLVAETSASNSEAFRGEMLRNGVDFHSYHFQKKLAAAIFLEYGGSYCSGGSMNAQVGGFFEATFDFLMASEVKAVVDASTGAVSAAPTGRVIDTVAGFSNLELNDVAIAAVAQGISLNVVKNNARAQFGLGAAAAQGMARGTVSVDGTISIYFIDFTLYDLYKAETDQLLVFRALDDLGQGYVITIPAATLMNPSVVAGGPDTDILSDFDLEGNPGLGAYANVILQIDKFAAAP